MRIKSRKKLIIEFTKDSFDDNQKLPIYCCGDLLGIHFPAKPLFKDGKPNLLTSKENDWSFGTIVNEKGQLGIGNFVIQLIDGKYRVYSNKAGAHVFISPDQNYLWRANYYIKDLGEMRFHKTYVDMFNAHRTDLTTHEYLDDDDELRTSTREAYLNHINDLMEMMKLNLYQNNETKELVVIREQTEDSVKVKHLHAPVWETLTLEQFNEQYHVVEEEGDIE